MSNGEMFMIMAMVGLSISIIVTVVRETLRKKRRNEFVKTELERVKKEFSPIEFEIFSKLTDQILSIVPYEMGRFEGSINKIDNHNKKVKIVLEMQDHIRNEDDEVERQLMLANLEAFLVKDEDIIDNNLNIIDYNDRQTAFLAIKDEFDKFEKVYLEIY